MRVNRRIAFRCIFLVALIVGAGCSALEPIGPSQDIRVKETSVNLKVEARNLMAKATEPYSQHQAEAAKFQSDMEKAYEYAASIPKNQDTAQQWAIMKDPNGRLMGGFLKRWQEKSTLSATYLQEKQKQIAEGFDLIIQLETSKPKQ